MSGSVRVAALFAAISIASSACGDDTGSRTTLEGDGEIVTEITTVPEFSRLRIENGINMTLTVDEEATGDVKVGISTDSNLIESMSVSEVDGTLTASVRGAGGLHPSEGFDVSATVASIQEVEVDNRSSFSVDGPLSGIAVAVRNGSQATLAGTAGSVSLTATTESSLDASDLEAATADVLSSNDSSLTVCASVNVAGEVDFGSTLTVLCGADVGSVTIGYLSSVSTGP